jgi:hypothetical protein
MAAFKSFKQMRCGTKIVCLPRRQHEPHWQATLID